MRGLIWFSYGSGAVTASKWHCFPCCFPLPPRSWPICLLCRTLEPIYEKLAGDLKGRGVVLAKVDCISNRDLQNENGIRHFPTIKLFKNGGKDVVVCFASRIALHRIAAALCSVPLFCRPSDSSPPHLCVQWIVGLGIRE